MLRETLVLAGCAYCLLAAATSPGLPQAAAYAAGAMLFLVLSHLADD